MRQRQARGVDDAAGGAWAAQGGSSARAAGGDVSQVRNFPEEGSTVIIHELLSAANRGRRPSNHTDRGFFISAFPWVVSWDGPRGRYASRATLHVAVMQLALLSVGTH